MNTRISHIMDKEVSRQEFLGMSALAVASVFGLGTLVKVVTGKSLLDSTKPQTSGYGVSAYGR